MHRPFLLSVLLTAILTLFPLKTAQASHIGFVDNFSDGNALEWQEVAPWGSWTIQDGTYIGKVTLISQPEKPSTSKRGDTNWQDYSFSVDIKGLLGVDKQIAFRVDENNRAYVVNLRSEFFNGGDDLVLVKKPLLGGTAGSILKSVPYNNSQNETYRLTVDVINVVNGVNIKVAVNGISQLEYTDTINYIPNGAVGFEVWPGGYQLPISGLETSTAYDNVSVKTLHEGTILNVPNLKQGGPTAPWGEFIYNNYPSTATTQTIRKWGCYLTSAAMLLQANNYSVDPGQLNSILKTNKGFTSAHGVDLAAVAAHTKTLNPTNHLEYKWYNFSTQTLDSELAAGRAPIVKLQGNALPFTTHFIVVTGKQNNEYLINDPEPTSTKTKLSEYSPNLYNHIRTLVPSQTDFSYINIYTSLNITPKLFDPDGNEVTGFSYVEGPIKTIDGSEEVAGEALNVLSYPKPEFGDYLIKLAGAGAYNAEIKLFDPSGNLVQKIIEEPDNGLHSNEVKIKIAETNEIVEPEITLASIIKYLDSAYSQKLIKNKTVYQIIKTELLLAKYFESKNKTALYKGSLKLAIKHIQKATPKYITLQASQKLIKDITFLLQN